MPLTPTALSWAACLALVLACGAGSAQASTAAALATESQGLPGHRGVPGGSLPRVNTAPAPKSQGPQASGGSGGSLPRVNTVTQPAPPVTASAFPLEPAGTP